MIASSEAVFLWVWLMFAAYGVYVIGRGAVNNPEKSMQVGSFFWRLFGRR